MSAATYFFSVPIPFRTKRKPKATIKKAAKPVNGRTAPVTTCATKVGLKPRGAWHRRNFLTQVLIPSLFAKRAGGHAPPVFPKLAENEIGITWIGHASFLVQAGGHSLLVDPNWAKWLKVIKRIRHPGLHLHDLPAIDLVLVTHAHFDHLDRKTLRELAADQPIVVPFEVGNLVHDLGFHSVHELHYWQTYEQGPIRITLTPCHHWGARILHDSHRGFGGFIMEISAYDPPSGREVHMNPEEAVQAFMELGARRMIPMHYGSFRLSYEPVHEPPQRLLASARAHGIEDRISVMTEGLPMVF